MRTTIPRVLEGWFSAFDAALAASSLHWVAAALSDLSLHAGAVPLDQLCARLAQSESPP